ncbi:MAG: metallopeptidase family protein [Kiritimatiellaeota bacterium]|nr:metallopeptidase family protein [Kiritimatiellota bacterium]
MKRWYDFADAAASALMKSLPLDLRGKLAGVAITLSGKPDPHEVEEEGDEDELLGLFIGATLAEGGADSDFPPEIRLFVENIRDETGDDVAEFKREVRTTLLHEIGHYLGLDEDALELRGLS